MRWVLYVILFSWSAIGALGSPVVPCYKECDVRLISDEEDFDVSCNETCKVQKCHDGCDLWTSAISSSCHEVCEEDKKVFKNKLGLYCIRGCNIAINLYMKAIEGEVGTPAPPYLVAETRTNVSIAIQWTPSPYHNISYLVQLRYDNLHQVTDWEYYKPTNLVKDHYLNVEELHPYTKYRFRVAWILLENYPPLFSEESIVISTLPYGAPSTPPIMTCLTAVSCTRISLSWDPPPLPNGPILSYVLYIQELPFGNIMIKDISDTSDGLHYMINNLKSSTTYKISLSTRNSMGEGPQDVRNITTLSKKEVSSLHNTPAYLVFGSKNSIVKQGLRILDESHTLYKVENESVTGVALHVKRNTFFVTDSSGNLHSVNMKGLRENEVIHSSSNYPTILSLDWLNEKIYIVEENQISRCDLNGKHYEIVLNNMKYRAADLHVDPLNGYLYVTMGDHLFEGGLYRIDLIELDSGESVEFEKTQLIVSDHYLTAFVVDYKNFRILLPTNNTIVSVALDGSDVSDIRENSQTSLYKNIKSLAVYQDLLYYTTGSLLYGEEYHKLEDKFYQNVYSVGEGPFLSLNIYHMDYQPLPRPLNPVESVQALFGVDVAKISWTSPRLLGGQGKGSWEKWMYEVQLTDNSLSVQGINISENVYDISSLKPNTSYSIKVRAYSDGGKGPWSSEFKGSTLKNSERSGFPYILYGGKQGLLKSDFVGENVESLIDKMNLNNAYITDICWYDKMLFINTNTTFLYVYNSSIQPSLARLPNITMATSIAIDWYAPKLYWSSAVQQMISRSNIDGSQPEPLPILTMAKEIAIDSVHAHLYWATSHSVERSYLNGMEHFVYMKNALFSGKHVMGLTLDFDMKKVYWMVRSYEGSIMYRACLARTSNFPCNPQEPEIVGSLSEDGLHGPVWYFNHRVFWLHENQRAFVSDIKGNNFARIYGQGLNGLTSMEIIDPSLHPYPEELDMNTIKVVPSSISESAIRIVGTHDRFNITWDPVLNVNYGIVFYEIRVDDGDEVMYSLITNETVFVYPTMKRLQPYTPLTIGMQAFTYWASSKQTIVVLPSPSSVPSRPLHPRIFVTHRSSPLHRNKNIIVDFRWSPPEKPNGIVLSYDVSCWFMDNDTRIPLCDDLVSGKFLQYEAKHLLPNTTYYFQVNAITAAGPGESSEIVEAETSIERPVPKLLLANADSVKVADIDFHEEKLLFSKATHPAAIAYLAQEKRVFVLEEEGALMVSSLDGTNASLIKHLVTEGTSLSVDWVGRQLYWAEVDKEAGHSSVWSVDLSYNSYPKKIFDRTSIINSLEVEPFSGSLIWTRALNNNWDLMISDTSGSNIRPFFWQYEASPNRPKVKRTKSVNSPLCNCSRTGPVGSAITIDNTDKAKLRILFVDAEFGHIWSSDIEGCFCQILINATENYGLPPTSLTVDSSRIYWSNKTIGKVYSMSKLKQFSDSEFPIAEEIRGIRSIRAIGHHLQPYPDASCLVTESYSAQAELIKNSSSSLTLYLPQIQRPKLCNKISSPSVLFTIYYGPTYEASTGSCFIRHERKLCKTMSTYNNTIILHNLQPFTNYSIRVSVMNYYSKGLSTLGPEAVYQTAVGTPSPPVHISAYSVTPYRIDISWLPPLLPNGDPILYEIRWKTKNSTRDALSTIQSECGKESSSELSATIITTEAGKDHYITVRAYSSDCEKFSDSEEFIVTAFPVPNNLTLVNTSSTSMSLSWISPDDKSILQHYLEYSEVENGNWYAYRSYNDSTIPSTLNIFLIENLVPKTKYKFRLILTYRELEELFLWPQGFTFEFVTSGDVPSVPGQPHVKHVGREVYQVVWEESRNNGDMDILYELEIRSDEEDVNEWKFVTNTSISQYIINNFSVNTNYEFRIRAINEYGRSNFSYSEKLFYLPEARAIIDPADDPFGIIIASSVAIVILLAIFLAILYIIHLKRQKNKKSLLQETTPSNQLASDLELATLEDLPLHANFVHQTNALYNLNDLPTDEELLALPQIHKDQIIVTKFLGSGAFGEVFEGVASGLSEEQPSLKIAIKTLKKGSTDLEKDEFLKEAKLMSNFKHGHILQLLGVCFDNNPNFIILELMEGGDLLSYLRTNRPTVHKSSDLTMDDLVGICIDVAEGCKYLEDMHFVHRDLAARNCLVSSHNRSERIVKIGDFGLARDIYKNDYYRKEGEGLLPVRWMAPESLLYGVFTCQSDVWAFGVLLWEVMTLGMQPYPARSNMEVLYYVRAGGLLDKPENCPDELHQVMISCWKFDPDTRPAFYHSLRALQDLRANLSTSAILPVVYSFNYFDQESFGFDNLGYCGSLMSTSSVYESSSKNDSYSVAVAGTYVGRQDAEESRVKLLDTNYDSRSTQSDPATASETIREGNPSAMRRSLSWATLQTPDNRLAAMRMSARVNNRRQPTNKYLELLGNTEDSDGYQLPLRAKDFLKPFPPRKIEGVPHRAQAAEPVASSSYEVMRPSLSFNHLHLPFITEPLDSSGSADLPGECSLQHSPIGDELEAMLEPDQRDRSGSTSTVSLEESWMEDCDKWSFSTASTATCQLDTNVGSQENLNSALSCIAGIDIDNPSTSSYC